MASSSDAQTGVIPTLNAVSENVPRRLSSHGHEAHEDKLGQGECLQSSTNGPFSSRESEIPALTTLDVESSAAADEKVSQESALRVSQVARNSTVKGSDELDFPQAPNTLKGPGHESADGRTSKYSFAIETEALRPASPTGSVSSLLSSDSTSKLIKTLSINELTKKLETDISLTESQVTVVPVMEHDSDLASSRTTPVRETKGSRKPVKFTVRKVSRETNVLRDHVGDSNDSVTHRYGNLPQNKAQIEGRKPSDKHSQLEHLQTKHDQYTTRVVKIEKEIRFLASLLPPYNVEIDYATRTKITRAIDKLQCKKDEIEKKKYDLGMSISRLWREFDDNNTWVRSVSKH